MYSKKMFFVLIIAFFNAHAWNGRVLPVAYDTNEKEWSLLLGHNKNSQIWSDFGADGTATGKKANAIALEAFKAQTNGVYNLSTKNTQMTFFHDKNADEWFHLAVVPFKHGKDLYSSATNNIKDDFVWIKLSDALKSDQVIHKKGGTIEKNLYTFITDSVPEKIKELSFDSTNSSVIDCPDKKFKNVLSKQQWPIALTSGISVITFYTKNEDYYAFANTFMDGTTDPKINTNKDYSVTIFEPSANKELTWASTEHYFQAGKFRNPEKYESIINQQNASQLQLMARNNQYPFDQTKDMWNSDEWFDQQRNINRMLMAVATKFLVYNDLKKLILGTTGNILVEDAGANDAFWGAGPNYTGCNHLGQMLMQVRDQIINLSTKNVLPAQQKNTHDYKNLHEFILSNFSYAPHEPDFYIKTYKNNQLTVLKANKSPDESITQFAQALANI